MRYLELGKEFVPAPCGEVTNPLSLDPAVADELFGKELMDALRERAKNPRTVNRYVQISPPCPDPEGRAQ